MNLLFDNFDKLAEAPGGIKKLREMILQLAVQGKLVPQDPKDEPASVLLEKIRTEKEWLVKEGKIKKTKPLEPIKNSAIPFAVPDGWEWVRLGDIIYITSGKGLNSKDMQDGNIPVYGGNGITGYHNTYNLEKRTLVIGRVGFYCGSIHITPDKAWVTDNAFKTIFSEENIDMHFLELLLKTFDLKEKESATAQPVISGRKIYPILLPLASLTEQKRIVAKVDSLMTLCDDLEKQQQEKAEKKLLLNKSSLNALSTSANQQDFNKNWNHIANNFDLLYSTPENIDGLKQTILQLAVMGKLVPQDPNDEPATVLLEKIQAEKERLIQEGKIIKQKLLEPINDGEIPFEAPNKWKWVRFDDIVKINSGITKGRNLTGKQTTIIPYLRVANVQRNCLDLRIIKEIEIPIDEVKKFSVEKRDLLIIEGGDWDKVGRTAIWKGELRYIAHQNHIFKATLLKKEQNENWLEKYLNSIHARDYFASSSKQTTNLASINKTQLRGCLIPMPPLAEQKRIVEKVDSLMTLCNQLKENLIIKCESNVNLLNAVVSQL